MLQGGRRPGQRVDPELGSLDLAPELICKVKRLIAFSFKEKPRAVKLVAISLEALARVLESCCPQLPTNGGELFLKPLWERENRFWLGLLASAPLRHRIGISRKTAALQLLTEGHEGGALASLLKLVSRGPNLLIGKSQVFSL
jgi:hypothetical protein